jgi:hypothetical protein
MSIYEEKLYFSTETDLSKHFVINEIKKVPQSPKTKPSKKNLNIKKEINKFNSKLNLIKSNKRKEEKQETEKELSKLGINLF